MARVQWIGLAVLSLSLTGCVAQGKYDALKLDRDQKAEQLAKAQSDATSARGEAELLRQQLNAMNGTTGSRDALFQNLTSQNAELQARLAELNQKYMDALRGSGQGGPLPAPLANELQKFAEANPDLVEFDSAHGMVKFKSDVTFATGSADLTDKAKSAIQRFSAILNSSSAASYELIVAGHTDNTPVVNPETKRKGHLNNWYLSAHRAISVGDELQHNGVNGKRLGVTGYADNRPIASNSTSAGKAQNRRVEVLILPTQATAPVVTSTPRTTPRRAARPEMNKDAVVAPSRPVLNK